MQTIIIVLDPGKLKNPVADLRYAVPECVERLTGGVIQDNGYNYLDCEEGAASPPMALWLQTPDAMENWPMVLKILQEKAFFDNDLSLSAKFYISENDTEELQSCLQVYFP